MSLAFSTKVRPVLVRDPRTLVAEEATYAVLKGGSQVTSKVVVANSISTNALSFSAPPPSGGVFVDRCVKLYVPIRLVFSGVPALGQPLLRPGFDAPRAWPLHSAIEALNLTLNNTSFSTSPSNWVQPLVNWYNSGAELKNSGYSTTPCSPDQSTSYNDLVGTNRNPLGGYANICDNVPAPRGAFPFVVIANPLGDGVAEVVAVVDVAFTEALIIPPLQWGRGVSDHGLFNLTSFDLSASFLSQAAPRLWSHSDANGGVPFTGISYNIGGGGGPDQPTSFPNAGAPSLQLTYITPQESQLLSPSMQLSYPYFTLQSYSTAGSPVAAGASVTMISNNVQLASIPRRMYLFVRRRNQDLYADARSTDTYFALNNLSIQFMNKTGLLSSCSQQQLYSMCVKNHCTMSWTQWSGYAASAGASFVGPSPAAGSLGTVGSVMCVEFGSDIGLDSLDAPGKLNQGALQVQVNVTNQAAEMITPELWVIIVSEGVFTIEGLNRASVSIGVISSNDILEAQKAPGIDYRAVQEVNGGDFMSSMKDGLKKALTADNIMKGLSLANRGLKATHAISNLASLTPFAPASIPIRALGYGEGGGIPAGQERPRVRFSRGQSPKRRSSGGALLYPSGGEDLSRADLARRILY